MQPTRVDSSRVAMVLAVLQRKAKISLARKDVYVSTVGGARIADPAADLALAIAMASATADENYFCRVVALGEVGLAGDLRRVPGLERRIGEAARLGFELAIVPAGSRDPNSKMPKMHGLRLVEVATVAEALAALGLNRNQKPALPH